MNKGFIKFYRNITEWEWYDNDVIFRVFFHLVATVNWKEKKWHGVTVKRGQIITTVASLADQLNYSTQQIRTALKNLQLTGEIKVESHKNKFTIITIVNYGKYQENNKQLTNAKTDKQKSIDDSQQTDNEPLTNQQQTDNKLLTMTKEVKEIIRKKEEYIGRRLSRKEKLEIELMFKPDDYILTDKDLEILGVNPS